MCDSADLQKQLDDLRDSVSDTNSKINALADHLDLVLEYEPKTWKVITKEKAEKEQVPTVGGY